MRSLFFLLIVSFPFSLTAQILRVSADEIKHHLYSSDAYFNKKFADINKLKTVTGKFSIKKELQPIKETGRSYIYDFDERGQMVKQLETFYKKGHVLDTSITYFYYDEKGNISLKRTNDPQGFFSYTYEYDSNDRMLYYSYNRDENANKNKRKFKLKRSFVIFSESYKYEERDSIIKRTVLNDLGTIYKEDFIKFNGFKQIIEKSHRFIVTGKKGKTNYEYDYYGRLVKKTEFTKAIKKLETVTIYEYDEFGNLLSEKTYRNENHIITKEFLYDENMLLKAQLTKDEASGTIFIIKFSYDFH